MLAAMFQASPARRRLTTRTTPLSRQAEAFLAGECALDGTSHGVTLLLYYKYLVALAGKDTGSTFSQAHVAADNQVCTRTIRRYDQLLEAAGLIRTCRQGTLIRRTIVAYDGETAPATAEMSAPHADISAPVLGPQCGQIDPVNVDRSIQVPPTIKRSRDDQDQGAAGAGGADSHPDRSERETVAMLTAIGCYPETVKVLSHLPPAEVRATIDAAEKCGRAHDLPAFVAYCMTTGGVYGAAPRPGRPRAAVPSAETRDAGYERHAAPPGFCTCGRIVPPEWHGKCPACYPDEFDPPPGGAP